MVRSRWKWVLLGVVLLLVAAELGLNALMPPKARVRVVNFGDYPIREMVLSTGSNRTLSATIEPQQSAIFELSGWGKRPLALKFTQFNNPMTDFEITDFEPRRLQREGSVLVLEVRSNEIARYQEPDDTPSRWQQVGEKVRKSLNEAKVPDAPP